VDVEKLIAEGETLHHEINAHLEAWPTKDGRQLSPIYEKMPEEFVGQTRLLQDRAHRWFNLIAVDVLPYTSYDLRYVNLLLRRVSATIGGVAYSEQSQRRDFDGTLFTERDVESPWPLDLIRHEAAEAMHLALRLVRTAAPSTGRPNNGPDVTSRHIQNTAFILMRMDPDNPELEDVHEAVKEVFAEFGVRAYRADEIEHQDRITDLILEQIRNAEFLFADLSGSRQNVYYEVGYAHALGKRPILYRKAGTRLHFDLSVHNVPEYANVTQLRKALRARLVAITGKSGKVGSKDSVANGDS
jgi:hypothetical protein